MCVGDGWLLVVQGLVRRRLHSRPLRAVHVDVLRIVNDKSQSLLSYTRSTLRNGIDSWCLGRSEGSQPNQDIHRYTYTQVTHARKGYHCVSHRPAFPANAMATRRRVMGDASQVAVECNFGFLVSSHRARCRALPQASADPSPTSFVGCNATPPMLGLFVTPRPSIVSPVPS